MVRKKLLIGNWKLNHSFQSANEFLKNLGSPHLGQVEAAIAPVPLMLDFLGQRLPPGIKLCGQNVFYETLGAFTGEYSALQLAELKVSFCIVGHSERRKFFNESDEDVAKKAKACLMAGITPVVCVGETLAEREDGQAAAKIKSQVEAIIEASTSVDQEIIFAYEPLWAIGSGKSASLKDIEEIHRLIRALLNSHLGITAEKMRILYGGSVSPENIAGISTVPDVDGVLVGGASLQAESFLAMVEKLQGA